MTTMGLLGLFITLTTMMVVMENIDAINSMGKRLGSN